MNVKIIRLNTINSTNEYAKSVTSVGEDFVVWAKKQSAGKGTKGRTFSSKPGGVYVTLVRFFENLKTSDAFTIMQNVAVAVCETLLSFGVQAKIKWPNDIYVGDKKICGILIENAFNGENVRRSVIGIGLNVTNRLEKELLPIATTLYQETGKKFTVEEVGATLIEKAFDDKGYTRYEQYLGWLGKEITLLQGEERIPCKLLGTDGRGNLLVEKDGEKRKFSAVEVSVRI